MAIMDCRCPQSGCELCGLPDDTRKQLQQLQAKVKRLQEEKEDRWHGELMAVLVEHVDNPAMCSVSTCAAPATCIGWCRDAGVAAMCDQHCGHGNEDSTCYPVLPTRAEVERLQEKLEATKGQLRYSGDPFYDDAAEAAEVRRDDRIQEAQEGTL